jgi:hypothetical protein
MEDGGRSTPRLIADTFGLYRRYPLLFLALAAAVIVPYNLLWQVIDIGSNGAANVAIGLALGLFYWVVIVPLVSALHVHAVDDVRADREPRFVPVARRGLAALPVVCAAAFASLLGIYLGLALFFFPGVFLWVRWLVVAQAAALEREGWTAALRRSWALSEGSWVHVFVFFVLTSLILVAPTVLLLIALKDTATAVAFPIETALEILLVSFTALATALLYYDLRARRGALATAWLQTEQIPPPADRHPDPRHYSDEERPRGWYVDPEAPQRMRYWSDDEPAGWRGKARTPRNLRRQWEDPG